MSGQKFTDGPWELDSFVVKTTRGIIANIPRPQVGGVFDCFANAHLIAAAPDLYAALEMASRALEAIYQHPKNPWKAQHGDGVPVHVFCDAALRKARGES